MSSSKDCLPGVGASTSSQPAVSSREEEIKDGSPPGTVDEDQHAKGSSGRIQQNPGPPFSWEPSRAKRPPSPADIKLEMSDSAKDNGWYDAIERKDCKELKRMLAESSAEHLNLWRYTGEKGRTVLHVAAMQGCFRLVKRVVDLISLRSESDWDTVVGGVDGRSGLTASVMAGEIIGNRLISQYICFKRKQTFENWEELIDNWFFYEASLDSDWYKALADGDCKELRRLLRGTLDPHSLLRSTLCTGVLTVQGEGHPWGGSREHAALNVLHVAVCMDDMELVKEVKKAAFQSNMYSLEAEQNDAHSSPPKLSWEDMLETRSWYNSEYEYGFFKKMYNFHTVSIRIRKPLELAEELGRTEIHDYLLNPHEEPIDDDLGAPLSHFRESLLKKWMEETLSYFRKDSETEWLEEEFQNNVDYNFEAPPRLDLLRLHYYNKRLLNLGRSIYPSFEFIRDKIPAVSSEQCQKIKRQMQRMMQLMDAQGRSPIMFTSYSYAFGNPFVLTGHYNDHDARGRTLLHRMIMEGHGEVFHNIDRGDFHPGLKSNEVNAIMVHTMAKFSQFNVEPLDYKICHTTWTPLQMAVLKEQIHSVEVFLSSCKEVQDIQDLCTSKQRIDLEACNDKSAIHIAAMLGNETILQMLLGKEFNPFIVDSEGRTPLHYAVDASGFEMLPIHLFTSVDDLSEFREKHKKINYTGKKACINMLFQAGIDSWQVDKYGRLPHPGPKATDEYQCWWQDKSLKETTDVKNNFNQAGNALSVVGTLVAATSYVGPLQPPLGDVDTSELLVRIFMVSNTMAFFFAISSVMFAVVPSLPMPQEGMLAELRRARHSVSLSLSLLLISILCVIISFAAASIVVIPYNPQLLVFPIILGSLVCFIAILSFGIRMLRLMFYKSLLVRELYEFSLSTFCMRRCSATWSILSRQIIYQFRLSTFSMRWCSAAWSKLCRQSNESESEE